MRFSESSQDKLGIIGESRARNMREKIFQQVRLIYLVIYAFIKE